MNSSFDPYAFPRKPAYRYGSKDFWLALALWVVGYFYISTVPVFNHPLPALGVQLLLFGGLMVFGMRFSPDCRPTPWAWTLAGVGVALSLSYVWSVNRAILTVVALWNALAWFYLVFLLTGHSRERLPGQYFIGELITSVKMPFRAPGHAFGALFGPRRGADGEPEPHDRIRRTLGWTLLGLLLAIIPTLIIALLLSYDEGFSRVIKTILDRIFSAKTLFRQLFNLAVGLPIGALLFGAILAGKHHAVKSSDHPDQVSSDGDIAPSRFREDGTHILPVALIAAMLTPIMLIYILFFFSQWTYYVSAFTGVRPEALTFAAYAREGFFQLVVVAIINAGLSLGAGILAKRRPEDPTRPRRERTSPVIRAYLAVLALMTLVLIATALSKMFLYVGTYGMTHKRVYATWLMVLLAVAFVTVILRQLWRRLNLTGTLVAVFLAFFLFIALAPVDALIVRYNVNAAMDGNLRTMQGDVCWDSGVAGVHAALDFMEATADVSTVLGVSPTGEDVLTLTDIRSNTDAYLSHMARKIGSMDWEEHNLTTLRAKAALERAGYELFPKENAVH